MVEDVNLMIRIFSLLGDISFYPLVQKSQLNLTSDCRVMLHLAKSFLTLQAPRGEGGGGGGVENDPHQSLSSVIFARGMISKPNFG